MGLSEIKALLKKLAPFSTGGSPTAAAYAGTEDRARLIELAINGLPAVIEERDQLRADLERTSQLSVSGLCMFGLDAKHAVLKDIQKIGLRYGADALGSFPRENKP